MSKIISFSLWGNNPKYNIGAIRNAELAKQLFPDWICRFYIGQSVPDKTILALEALDPNCYIWHMDNDPQGGPGRQSHSGSYDRSKIQLFKRNILGDWRMMFDRFRPAYDSDVGIMLSRDCDSRLSAREKSAVDEWILSDKDFHTIHDHFYHTVPILGGMFGMKRDAVPAFEFLMQNWLSSRKGNYWQIDQEFLSQEIWPRVKDNTLNHSEFHTNIWPGKPIPIPRSGREFIGATYNEFDVIDPEQQKVLYG